MTLKRSQMSPVAIQNWKYCLRTPKHSSSHGRSPFRRLTDDWDKAFAPIVSAFTNMKKFYGLRVQAQVPWTRLSRMSGAASLGERRKERGKGCLLFVPWDSEWKALGCTTGHSLISSSNMLLHGFRAWLVAASLNTGHSCKPLGYLSQCYHFFLESNHGSNTSLQLLPTVFSRDLLEESL